MQLWYPWSLLVLKKASFVLVQSTLKFMMGDPRVVDKLHNLITMKSAAMMVGGSKLTMWVAGRLMLCSKVTLPTYTVDSLCTGVEVNTDIDRSLLARLERF